jgi:uncharacterized protein YndB with AHSA1/START domain
MDFLLNLSLLNLNTMEAMNLIAKAKTTINTPATKVWKALTTPALISEYMFGTTVNSDWKKGSAITWEGEMNGKKYKDKGEILAIVPNEKLSYSHYSPSSGMPDLPEHYHTVTIELREQEGTTVVDLTQGKNNSEKSKTESEKNWKTMLEGLKKCCEKANFNL